MKKLVTLSVLSILLVPAMVSASWWNPLSWNIFNKKSSIIQNKIEPEKTSNQKIEELQKQLDALKKENNVTNIISKDTAQKYSSKKVTTSSVENFNEIPLLVLDALIKNNQNYVSSGIKDIKLIEFSIELLKERRDFIISKNIYNDKDFNLLVKYCNLIIEDREGLLSVFNSTLDIQKKHLSDVEKLKEETKLKSYKDKESALSDAEIFNNLIKKDAEKNKNSEKIYNNLIELIEKERSEYVNLLTLTLNKIEASKPASNFYIPPTYYKPVVIPQIQVPKTTYCTMRGTGVNGTYDISCN